MDRGLLSFFSFKRSRRGSRGADWSGPATTCSLHICRVRVARLLRSASAGRSGWLGGFTRKARFLSGKSFRTCESVLPDSFLVTRAHPSLCESLMREDRTSGLSGGRRQASWGASSDPTLGGRESRPQGEGADGDTQPIRETCTGHVGQGCAGQPHWDNSILPDHRDCGSEYH